MNKKQILEELKNAYADLVYHEAGYKTVKEKILSLQEKLQKEIDDEDMLREMHSPNCPKCGRHDYALYGKCPTCDNYNPYEFCNIIETIKKDY